jgi:hypothetical protein
MKSGALRCAPSAFSGDDLETLAKRADDNGLDQPARGDRPRQFVERCFIEPPARLARMGRQRTNREHPQPRTRRNTGFNGLLTLDIAHQRTQAAAKARPCLAKRRNIGG